MFPLYFTELFEFITEAATFKKIDAGNVFFSAAEFGGKPDCRSRAGTDRQEGNQKQLRSN